jgi:hypothetical protein
MAGAAAQQGGRRQQIGAHDQAPAAAVVAIALRSSRAWATKLMC